MDDKLTSKLRENRRRVEENYMKNRFCRPDILKQKPDGTAVDEDTSKPGNKVNLLILLLFGNCNSGN